MVCMYYTKKNTTLYTHCVRERRFVKVITLVILIRILKLNYIVCTRTYEVGTCTHKSKNMIRFVLFKKSLSHFAPCFVFSKIDQRRYNVQELKLRRCTVMFGPPSRAKRSRTTLPGLCKCSLQNVRNRSKPVSTCWRSWYYPPIPLRSSRPLFR